MNDVYALKQPHPDGSEWIQGICHYAIQLRPFPPDSVVYGVEAGLWKHMGQKGCGVHDAEPPRFLIPTNIDNPT